MSRWHLPFIAIMWKILEVTVMVEADHVYILAHTSLYRVLVLLQATRNRGN